MEELQKRHDAHMGFYFSCPHCQQKYVSAECVQEHVPNCHMQSLSIPQIPSYSSLIPRANIDLNMDSEGFQIRHEVIKKESQDLYKGNDHTNVQDETEDFFNLIDPEEIRHYVPYQPLPLEPRTTCPEPKILYNSKKNPHSVCKQVGYEYSDSPQAFPIPSFVQKYELEPEYLCHTCGKRFTLGSSLVNHMKSHREPAATFQCCFPGCVQTFQSNVARWYHHKTHPRGSWNEFEWRPRMLKKSQPFQTSPITTLIPKSEYSNDQSYPLPDCSIGDSSMTDSTGMGQPEMSTNAPSTMMTVIHNKNQPTEPLIARNVVALNSTGPRKLVVKEILPNVNVARQPSHKILVFKISKSDQNVPRETQAEGLRPKETLLFVCGVCKGRFENFDDLKGHMLTTHVGPEESGAEEMEKVTMPAQSSGQFNRDGGQAPVELKEIQVASNLPENLNPRIQLTGPSPRYPVVKIGDRKYFHCGLGSCEAVFNDRHARYHHHNKVHYDAYRSLLKNRDYRPLGEKKVKVTSRTQLKENNSEEEKKPTRDKESPTNFPFVQIDGKKYFWCDFPDCGIVLTNPEARHLHQERHNKMSSEETATTIAENIVGAGSQKEQKAFQVKPVRVVENNENEILGEALAPNQPDVQENPLHDDVKMPAQALHEESPMQAIPLFNVGFKRENGFQTHGAFGDHVLTEASTSNFNPARVNISNSTSSTNGKLTATAHRPPVKVRSIQGNRSQAIYPMIQIGAKTLFPCDFPGCTAVFNSRGGRYVHHKKHRMGSNNVNSRLKLTSDGIVWDSAEGCSVIE